MNGSEIQATIYTSNTGSLGKHLARTPSGELQKVSGGQIFDGFVETLTFSSLREFVEHRSTLGPDQALGYGICGFPKARLYSRAKRSKLGMPAQVGGLPVIERSHAHLHWPTGAGIIMLDHDPHPHRDGLDASSFYNMVCGAIPEMRNAAAVWLPSASSCIYDHQGAQLCGVRGSRLYLAVSNASQIADIGRLLFERLALNGHAWVQVSTSGQTLRRGPVDTAVWQPERLDYVRATCGPGLVQRPDEPVFFNEPGGALDAEGALARQLSARERGQLAKVWQALEAEQRTAAAVARAAWALDQARRRLPSDSSPDVLQTAAARITGAAIDGRLEGDHILHLADGARVTVDDVLSAPDNFIGARLHDPWEPEYGNGDRRIASIVQSHTGALEILSWAHGGTRTTLKERTTPEEDFGGFEIVEAITPITPVTRVEPTVPSWPEASRRAELPRIVDVLRQPDLCGKHLCFDAFLADCMIADYTGEPEQWRPLADNDYTRLRYELQLNHGFRPISKDLMRDAVLFVADENRVDSAQTWLERLPAWDGKPRIESFLPTYFGTEDTDYTRAVSRYIWTALAGRIIRPGLKADMVPIAVGAQGARKSSAVAAIVPDPQFFGEADLGSRDDNTARRLRGKLVVELAELRGLKTRDKESVKAFLSAQSDEWVPKYLERPFRNPRRFVWFGTTNRDDFLADETGSRRFLPFRAGQCDPEGLEAVRDQLWAEARAMFLQGGLDHWDAERLARQQHAHFEEDEPWANPIARWLESDAERSFVTAHAVLVGALYMTTSMMKKSDEMRVSAVLRRLGWMNDQRRVDGRSVRGYKRPPDVML